MAKHEIRNEMRSGTRGSPLKRVGAWLLRIFGAAAGILCVTLSILSATQKEPEMLIGAFIFVLLAVFLFVIAYRLQKSDGRRTKK